MQARFEYVDPNVDVYFPFDNGIVAILTVSNKELGTLQFRHNGKNITSDVVALCDGIKSDAESIVGVTVNNYIRYMKKVSEIMVVAKGGDDNGS